MPDVITIPDDAHADLLRRVRALSPKRQRQWRSSLTDKWGTKTRLIYRDGQLLNYSLTTRSYWLVWCNTELHSVAASLDMEALSALGHCHLDLAASDLPPDQRDAIASAVFERQVVANASDKPKRPELRWNGPRAVNKHSLPR
jgi:hypothetical protein